MSSKNKGIVIRFFSRCYAASAVLPEKFFVSRPYALRELIAPRYGALC